MGAVAGMRDAVGRVGVVNVDGHVDAYDGRTSPTGEAADIPVGALLGHAGADLLAVLGAAPVVRAGDAVVLGAGTGTRRPTWATCRTGSGSR